MPYKKGYQKSCISANIFNFYLTLHCFLPKLCEVSKVNKKRQRLKCDPRYKSFRSSKESAVLLDTRKGMLLKRKILDHRLKVGN